MKTITLTAAVALLFGSSVAQAHVYIGLQKPGVNGGAITQVADDPHFAAVAGLQYGPIWNIQSVTVTDMTDVLDMVSLNVGGTAPETLKIYATATDQGDGGTFLSGFTSNVLPAGWTAEMTTWLDPANGVFTLVQTLGGENFNAIGTDVDIGGQAPNGPYSVTALIKLDKTTRGIDSAQSTIHVSVPEPGALGLLGGLLLGMGVLLRRRRVG